MRITFSAILLALATLGSLFSTGIGNAAGPPIGSYSLSSVPAYTQEGNTVSLILTVSGFSSSTSITYSFRFNVRDPAGTLHQSQLKNYTTAPGQYQFSILVTYPSASFPGSNSLVGSYSASADELLPFASTNVASSSFYFGLTDSSEYERTQTVNIQASGYNASESVIVVIKTLTTSTTVFSQAVQASSAGIVTASWDIPVNATIDTHTVTLTGTSTHKIPADSQRFSVIQATVAITAITSSKSSYQRTEMMRFSFQATYPDGSIASTGVGLLKLMNPTKINVTLTATYVSVTQTFNATYTTTSSNETGTWTASLSSHSFTDSYGNTGPGVRVSSTTTLTPATLSVTVGVNTNFALGQQSKFNATITYPDGSVLTSGTVSAYLLYSGNPTINDTVPLVFDTGLGFWVGSYTPKASDTGGLWSLVVKASDGAPSSPDTGSATRAITLTNNTVAPGGSASFPLYYWGIIAALIAALLVSSFLAFKRRKETHARLKIDLEAVRSEAGRIESQDFFKSIKEQVTKDEEH